jgi:pimeloyl-ACP methyl ester carboxylesterase
MSAFAGVREPLGEVAGHRVHYWRRGRRRAGGGAGAWAGRARRGLAQPGALSGQGRFPRLYARSARLWAQRKPAGFSYSVHDEAEAWWAFMDALGLKQVDLGGWSMGGAIAQHSPPASGAGAAADAVRLGRHQRKPEVGCAAVYARTPGANWTTGRAPDAQPAGRFRGSSRGIFCASQRRTRGCSSGHGTMLTGQDATDTLLPQLKMPVLIVWGAEGPHHPAQPGREDASPGSAVATGRHSGLRPPGPSPVRRQVVEFLFYFIAPNKTAENKGDEPEPVPLNAFASNPSRSSPARLAGFRAPA